jgi:hypothetical protein
LFFINPILRLSFFPFILSSLSRICFYLYLVTVMNAERTESFCRHSCLLSASSSKLLPVRKAWNG